MIKFCNLLLISVALISCSANKKDDLDDLKNIEVIKTFFDIYENQNEGQAVDHVFQSNKWIRQSSSLISKDSLNDNITNVVLKLGDYKGYEILEISDIGRSYKVVSSIAKYDRQPIRYVFILYRPSELDKWQIQKFTYDFNLEQELSNTVDMSYY